MGKRKNDRFVVLMALSRPDRCYARAGESRNDFLEMILQVHADAEEFDVVGLEPARYRFASV